MVAARRRRRRALPASRLWSRCRDEDGHLIFGGGQDGGGYGVMTVHGTPVRTHVLAYRLSRRRRVPAGRMVTHRCGIKLCCNPACLKLGTHRSNAADAIAAGAIRRGEDHPGARLTSEQVLAIRAAYAAGLGTQAEVARVFEVGRSTVGEIVRLERWRHVGQAA